MKKVTKIYVLFALFVPLSVLAIPTPKKVFFDRACEIGEQYVISAVGDVLLHGSLQRRAARAKDFTVLWKKFNPYFQSADIAYANLEGPTARGITAKGKVVRDPGHVFDKKVYTSYPMFNYHESLLGDLVRSGMDILSTSNNHSLDRFSIGANRTIDAIEREGNDLGFTGTRRSNETENDRPWQTIVDRNGIRTAWIACTYGTNGIADKKNQVLHCFKKSHRQRINEIIAEIKDTVDAVIVTPHWGKEYKHKPSPRQVKFAREVLDSGATAVVGSHPHVLQPLEKYTTADGRETSIIYSLGNFVSGQPQLPRKATVVFFLGLTKNENGTHVNGVKLLPAVMTGRKELLPTSQSSDGRAALRHIKQVYRSEHLISYNRNPEQVVTNDQCF